MAISRDKKQTLVGEMTELLASSKMTVFAQYHGTSVADLQKFAQWRVQKVLLSRLQKTVWSA